LDKILKIIDFCCLFVTCSYKPICVIAINYSRDNYGDTNTGLQILVRVRQQETSSSGKNSCFHVNAYEKQEDSPSSAEN